MAGFPFPEAEEPVSCTFTVAFWHSGAGNEEEDDVASAIVAG